MKKSGFLSVAAVLVMGSMPFSMAARANLPSYFSEMRACQKSGEVTRKPFEFIDVLRARKDASKEMKEHCLEYTLVRNRVIIIEEENITPFIKALLDADNENLKAAQIFRIITGR